MFTIWRPQVMYGSWFFLKIVVKKGALLTLGNYISAKHWSSLLPTNHQKGCQIFETDLILSEIISVRSLDLLQSCCYLFRFFFFQILIMIFTISLRLSLSQHSAMADVTRQRGPPSIEAPGARGVVGVDVGVDDK